jgi:hypothetical protein
MLIGITFAMPKGPDDRADRSDLRRGARLNTSYASAVASIVNTEDRRLAVMCALVAAVMLQDPDAAEEIESHPLLTAGQLSSVRLGSRDRLVWQAAPDREHDTIDVTDLELEEAVEAIRRQTDPNYRSARSEFLEIVAQLDRQGVDYRRTARADEIYVRGSMERIAIDRHATCGYVVAHAAKDKEQKAEGRDDVCDL